MKTRLKKRLIVMSLALLLIFGGIIGFNLFKAFMMKRFFANYEPPAVTVSSVTAKTQTWAPSLSAVGNFVAINGVDVNSEASGNVETIHFHSGEFIEANQPLIDIEDEVDQATLKFNEAELTLQTINYQRQADLFKRGATPSSSVDAAKAKLVQAKAEVEKTKALIRQKHITAPFSGRLGIRQVNLGQYIMPGQTSIVTLQSLDPLFLEFYLPEHLIKRVHLNQTITFSVEQNPDVLFEGQITAINSKVDINTHNVLIQATVANCPTEALKPPYKSTLITVKQATYHSKPILICHSTLNQKHHITEFNFVPGMFSAIEVDQPDIPDVVVLPSTAISYSLYGDSVFLIEQDAGKTDKNNQPVLKVKRAFVETGDQQGNYTVIKRGIKAGQTVVSSGELKLQDGTRVVINNDVQLDQNVNLETLSE